MINAATADELDRAIADYMRRRINRGVTKMRLIDADSLLANMNKGMQGTAREYLKFYQMVVNDEPTVYDVDKVVNKIRKEIGDCQYECEKCKQSIDCDTCRAEKAVEIVKAGGIRAGKKGEL